MKYPTPAGVARHPQVSLAALLHIGADEVFRVLLEHIVDLVEQVVRVLGELLTAFLSGRTISTGAVVVATATRALGLLLRHSRRPPRVPTTARVPNATRARTFTLPIDTDIVCDA